MLRFGLLICVCLFFLDCALLFAFGSAGSTFLFKPTIFSPVYIYVTHSLSLYIYIYRLYSLYLYLYILCVFDLCWCAFPI